MRTWYRLLFALSGVSALTLFPGSAFAAEKATELAERYFNPLAGSEHVFSDVAEVEPNSHLAQAQRLNCGDVLRPANISAAGDTDYVYFNVTAGTVITVGTDADGATGQLVDSRIRLFSASGVVVASDDDSGPGAYSLLTYTATYTGVYYVGIAGYSASYFGIYKAFITCQVPQPPPVNDQCAGALPIECGVVNLSGTTAFATADYTPFPSGLGGCTGYPAVGKDVVYKINATGGDVLDVNYTSAADGSIYLITNCADAQGSCVAGADATLSGVAEHLVYNVTSSGVYYLILDNYGTGAGGAYTLVGSYTCPATAARRTTWGNLKTIYR